MHISIYSLILCLGVTIHNVHTLYTVRHSQQKYRPLKITRIIHMCGTTLTTTRMTQQQKIHNRATYTHSHIVIHHTQHQPLTQHTLTSHSYTRSKTAVDHSERLSLSTYSTAERELRTIGRMFDTQRTLDTVTLWQLVHSLTCQILALLLTLVTVGAKVCISPAKPGVHTYVHT